MILLPKRGELYNAAINKDTKDKTRNHITTSDKEIILTIHDHKMKKRSGTYIFNYNDP